MMVLFTNIAAVELSVWIGDGGCFQPISINVWRMCTIYLAIMYSAPSSASAYEGITNMIIWAIMRISRFHLGVGSFSDKICGLLHRYAPWTCCQIQRLSALPGSCHWLDKLFQC